MKIDGISLAVLCVVLAARCEEHHHIEQRVLENKASLENITKNDPYTNDTKLSPSSGNSPVPLDAPEKMEQDLNSLVTSSVISSNSSENNKTVESNDLPEVSQVLNYNVSSLLRANTSVSPVVLDPVYIGVASDISSLGIQAPNVFPNGMSINGTKIIEADTEKILILISQQNNATVETNDRTIAEMKNQISVNTEVKDLLNNTNQEELASHQHPLEPQEALQISDKINDETELIENGQNTEDQLRTHEESDLDDESGLQQKYLAPILVCSLVAVSVICYAVLLAWRRYLENRYGSRTMLVNEEEFDDPNDMRHFSI